MNIEHNDLQKLSRESVQKLVSVWNYFKAEDHELYKKAADWLKATERSVDDQTWDLERYFTEKSDLEKKYIYVDKVKQKHLALTALKISYSALRKAHHAI